MVSIYASVNPVITAFRAQPTVAENVARVEEAAREAINRMLTFAAELIAENRTLWIIEYAARKFMGDVECATSATAWKPRGMKKIEGTAHRFILMSLLPRDKYEYKFIEDHTWEYGHNRSTGLELATHWSKDESADLR